MTRLDWNSGSRYYLSGVDRGVVYITPSTPNNGFTAGVVWPGLVSVEEAGISDETEVYYVDGVIFGTYRPRRDFQLKITSLSPPLTSFSTAFCGLSYRIRKGDRTLGTDRGYILRLIYNARLSSLGRVYNTLGEGNSPSVINWDVRAYPPAPPIVSGQYQFVPTAFIDIDSTTANPTKLATLEDILYGTASVDPILPSQAAVLATLA